MPARFPRRLLIDSVAVQRVSGSTVDERGNQADAWATTSNNVPARIDLQSETEARQGTNTVVKSFSCIVPGDTDVKASDRLYEASTGRYYEINSVNEGRKLDGGVYYKSLSLLFRE